jgi:hypothetical protein
VGAPGGEEAGGRAVLAATHHPPRRPRDAFAAAFRGLANVDAVRAVLREHPRLHVIHGHMHGRVDTRVVDGEVPRIFGAPAVVDARRSPLRLYRCGDGRVSPV